MKTQLSYIQEIINTYSAREYADMKMKEEKKNYKPLMFNAKTGVTSSPKMSYDEYLRDYYGTGKKEDIETYRLRSYAEKLNRYAEIVKMYTGWMKNGKLFALNTKELFLCFFSGYYEIKSESEKSRGVNLEINYNPLNVDIVSQSMPEEYYKKEISSGVWVVDTDEKKLMKMLDEKIKKNKTVL